MDTFTNGGIQEMPEIPAESETFDEANLSANPVPQEIKPEALEDSLEEPKAPVDVEEPIEKEDDPEVPGVLEDVPKTIEAEEIAPAAIEEETVEAGMSKFHRSFQNAFSALLELRYFCILRRHCDIDGQL